MHTRDSVRQTCELTYMMGNAYVSSQQEGSYVGDLLCQNYQRIEFKLTVINILMALKVKVGNMQEKIGNIRR